MKQLAAPILVLAVLSLAPLATAQTSPAYMTVDAVNVTGASSLAVTGVPQGQQTAVTREISFTYVSTDLSKATAFEMCHRQLLLALSTPGKYVVQAGQNMCRVALVAP